MRRICGLPGMGYTFILCACILLAVSGCSDKKPASSSSDGGGAVTVNGTWGVVSVQTVVNDSVTGSTTVNPDSSDRYMVIDGVSVLMYLLDTSGWNEIDVRIGFHESDTIFMASDTLLKMMSGNQLMVTSLKSTGNTVTHYIYEKYGGIVPPYYWLSNYGDVDDDTFEPDDRLDSATPLVVGEPQLHSAPDDDTDWFSVQMQPHVMYYLYVTYGSYNHGVVFTDADSNVLDESDVIHIDDSYNDYECIEISVDSAMTVYVGIDRGVNNNPLYDIRLESLSLTPSPYTGAFYLSSYSQSFDTGDALSAQDTVFSSATTPLIVVLESYRITYFEYDDFNVDTMSMALSYLASSAMVFNRDTVAFTRNGDGLVFDYTDIIDGAIITRHEVLMPYAGTVLPPAWSEIPGIPTVATSLVLNAGEVSASFSSRFEYDWYRIEVSMGGPHTVVTSGSLNTEITLFRLDGDHMIKIDSDHISGPGDNALLTFSSTGADTYYAVISERNGRSGPYGVRCFSGYPAGYDW